MDPEGPKGVFLHCLRVEEIEAKKSCFLWSVWINSKRNLAAVVSAFESFSSGCERVPTPGDQDEGVTPAREDRSPPARKPGVLQVRISLDHWLTRGSDLLSPRD